MSNALDDLIDDDGASYLSIDFDLDATPHVFAIATINKRLDEIGVYEGRDLDADLIAAAEAYIATLALDGIDGLTKRVFCVPYPR